jgi:hypothetical protein
MSVMISAVLGELSTMHAGLASGCPPVPPLSYSPMVVGISPIILGVLDVAAGVACVGIVGNLLHWTADDHAPLRWLWMVLIVAGFAASAAGLYIGFANRVHQRAVETWLTQAAEVSASCLRAQSRSPNLFASTVTLSIQLGVVAIALITLGIVGAILERRGAMPKSR